MRIGGRFEVGCQNWILGAGVAFVTAVSAGIGLGVTYLLLRVGADVLGKSETWALDLTKVSGLLWYPLVGGYVIRSFYGDLPPRFASSTRHPADGA